MIRLAALWITVAAIVVLAIRRGPDFARRVAFLYHQRGCLRYTAPADQVVFDSNPARVAILASDPNFVIVGGCAFRKPPADWAAVRSSLSISPPPSSAVLFLHKRVVNGVSRLIMVERTAAAGESPYFIPGYDIDQHAIDPASIGRPARDIHLMYGLDVIDSIGPHTDIRIYAGQPDPADDSRFTIRYEFQGKSHVVEGRVAADGRIDFRRVGE